MERTFPMKEQSGTTMNIFFLSADPQECAMMHADKHVVKMILECAQMLSTAHRLINGHMVIVVSASGRKKKKWVLSDEEREHNLYAATHVNHPSVKWTMDSNENYTWLHALFVNLLDEYTYRYKKTHACDRLKSILASVPEGLSSKPFEQPWLAMPDDYKIAGDAIASYRKYYIGAKSHLFKWKHRDIPLWIVLSKNIY